MENLGIDPKLLIAQVINFAVFFILFKKFLAKPFAKFLDGEKNKDLEKEKSIQKVKKMEEEALRKDQIAKEKIKKEQTAVLADAKKQGEKIKEDILAQAREEAEEIKKKAKKQTEIEKEELFAEVKDKVTKLSFIIINDALKDALPAETKKKITEQILKNSSKQKVS